MSDEVSARTMPGEVTTLPDWALWTLAAYAATVFHILIDTHLGLFGEVSDQMSVVKGMWGLTQSVLLAWWMYVSIEAARGNGSALVSSLALTGVLALAFHGLIALAAAPPVSDAAPWQDLAHLGAVLAGFMALRAGARQFGERPWPAGGRMLGLSIVLVGINAAFAIPLNLEAFSS